MEFEFDLHKSVRNLDKHGIDFADAQLLWEDPNLLEIPPGRKMKRGLSSSAGLPASTGLR